jgi:hypothetical protein
LIDSAGRVFPSASRRWRVLTNHALAQGMCESVILIRYETWLRPEAARWSVFDADGVGSASEPVTLVNGPPIRPTAPLA